ncbi:hypothetical protein [Teichococcus aestuarii]|uniref:hypothetical protein n=1 Tax=Teichococcus aestuarii TaxID=568898 RepID=UPI003610A55F
MQRRPGRLRRFFRRGLIAAALILILAGLGAAGLLWASLPPRAGRIGLPGLSAPVEVVEDRTASPASPPAPRRTRRARWAGCMRGTGCSRWS